MGVDKSKDLLTVCRSIRRRRSFGHPPPRRDGRPTDITHRPCRQGQTHAALLHIGGFRCSAGNSNVITPIYEIVYVDRQFGESGPYLALPRLFVNCMLLRFLRWNKDSYSEVHANVLRCIDYWNHVWLWVYLYGCLRQWCKQDQILKTKTKTTESINKGTWWI